MVGGMEVPGLSADEVVQGLSRLPNHGHSRGVPQQRTGRGAALSSAIRTPARCKDGIPGFGNRQREVQIRE